MSASCLTTAIYNLKYHLLIILLLVILPSIWFSSKSKEVAAVAPVTKKQFILKDFPLCSPPKYTTHLMATRERRLVQGILEGAGLQPATLDQNWNILFVLYLYSTNISDLFPLLTRDQKMNRIPGFDVVTSKVSFATRGLPAIPAAFRIPEDNEKLKDYAQRNPKALFVKKNNRHKGIEIVGMEDVNMTQSNSFMQVFVEDPLLIEGHKFDVGVYVVVTSINPLRAYVYEDEVLIKFCSEKYEPFDPKDKRKYVIDNEYPRFRIHTYSKYEKSLGYSNKETLNFFLDRRGLDSKKMWKDMGAIIGQSLLPFEAEIAQVIEESTPNKHGFFELFRADFFIDNQMGLHLMEFEREPYLGDSFHMPEYHRMVQALLPLVLTPSLHGGLWCHSVGDAAASTQVPAEHQHILPNVCGSKCAEHLCELEMCSLCRQCINHEEKKFIREAILEERSRHQFRRVFPPPVTMEEASTFVRRLERGDPLPTDLSPNNNKMRMWYMGKCHLDSRWCA